MEECEKLESLRGIIRFRKAIDAICHVIGRVRKFNEAYNPFKIKLVGIGGSSVRTETPRDIDIYIEASTIPGIWQDWINFKHKLDEHIDILVDLLWTAREHKKRATINDLIKDARKELLKQGVGDKQFDSWFKWLRISDIQFGLNHGIPIVDFSGEKLVTRFITAGWKGRKLEIHSAILDIEKNSWIVHYDIPHLVVWKINEGVIIPSEDNIKVFNQREYVRLSKLAIDILELICSEKNDDINYQKVPSIYHQAILLIKDHNETRFENFRKELKAFVSYEVVNIAKKYLKKDRESVTHEDNTALRESLKRFSLAGKIYEKINALDYGTLDMISKKDNPKISLIEILSRRLRRDGFWKKDIIEVIDAVDANKLIEDIFKLKQRFKDACHDEK